VATGTRVASYVLDSFAVIAHLQGEARGGPVRSLLAALREGRARVCMSVINVGEVIYRARKQHGVDLAEEALRFIRSLSIELHDVDLDLTLAAAELKAEHPIAYADAFAAALAQKLDAKLVTGDPEFKLLEDIISIEWL